MAKRPCCVIPLWLIFLLQALLVWGAFAAVIIMMTVRFNEEYTDAVHEKLSMSQLGAGNKILYRYQGIENIISATTDKYLNARTPPTLLSDNSTFTDLQEFYDVFYVFPQRDHVIRYVYQNVHSNYTIPGTNIRRWTVLGLDPTKYALGVNGTLSLARAQGPQPWDATKIVVGRRIPFEMATSFGYSKVGTITSPWWSSFIVFKDPQTFVSALSNAFYIPFDIVTSPTTGKSFARRHIAFIVNARSLLPAIEEVMASNESTKALIFALGTKHNLARTFVTGHVDFPLFNTTKIETISSEDGSAQWFLEDIPDPQCRRMIMQSEAKCIESVDMCRTPVVFEYDDHVVAAATVGSPTLSDLLLIQYTPRDFFYKEAERTRRSGILIGVFAALAVTLSCILIWLAIKRPLSALQNNMDLAADMRNDEVVTTSPVLSEITTLTRRFTAMNNKLLAARPFLPQSLLQGEAHSDEDEDEGFSQKPEAFDQCSESVAASGISVNATNTNTVTNTNNPSTAHNKRQSDISSTVTDTPSVLSRSLVPNNTRTCARYKRVAVLCVNVRNYIGYTRDKGLAPEMVVSVVKMLLSQMQNAAQGTGGIVDYFHGDRFVCTFNAAKNCLAAGRGAALCSLAIKDAYTASPLCELFPKGLAMGLSVGRALVGNMGTDTMKRFSTVGAVYTEAVALQDTMRLREDNGALFMGTALPDIEHAVLYEVVGVVPAERLARGVQQGADCLPDYAMTCNQHFLTTIRKESVHNRSSSVVMTVEDVNNSNGIDMSVHVLVAVVRRCNASTAADEWMYELQDMQSSNPYKATNTAFIEHYLLGKSNNNVDINIPNRPL